MITAMNDPVKSEIYDLVIIGAGPAGLTAAVYACRKRLRTVLLTIDIGGQAALSADIENYPGFSVISGTELARHFRQHIEHFPDYLEIHEGTKATALRRSVRGGAGFEVDTDQEQTLQARTVIIASGRRPRLLGIPGEKEFFGRGVFTSTSTNMSAFRDKAVAVVGGGNSAMDSAVVLARFARIVYIVNNLEDLHGDEMLKDKVLATGIIKVYNRATATKILGDRVVSGVEIEHLDSKESQKLEVEGVFIEVGWAPAVEFDRLTAKDDRGRIKVDPRMATSVAGIFAAGDVNDSEGEQIIIAAGEGAKATLSAAEYLLKREPLKY